MRAQPVLILVALLLLPACLTVIADPTVTITSPQENDVINANSFTVTGTAQGSSGRILQSSVANLMQGTHTDTTVTDTGEVVIFPMPTPVKQNNGDPVLVSGPDGTFDDDQVSGPSVVLRTGTFHMWYGGNDENNNRIGYATSPDGIAWTKQNGGVFVLDKGGASDFDSFGVYDPWVIDDGGTWKMWYTGSDGLKSRVGYAESADGVSWTPHGSPVLDLGDWGKFDEDGTASPTVVKDGSTYHMWYLGTKDSTSQFGYATSSNGISWSRQNNGNPVMGAGSSGKFDVAGVLGPSVYKLNGVFKMFYTGNSGSVRTIGLATSVDGMDWVRQNNGDPVLTVTNGKFDWKHVANPCVLLDGMNERMWYGGTNSTTTSMGYAVGTIGSVEGTYESPPFDLGGNVQWETINWTSETPAGTTVSVEVRTQVKNQAWGNWFTPSNGAALGSPDAKNWMYRVTMTSDDIAKTPQFKDITQNFYKPIIRVEVTTNQVSWLPCTGTTDWSCDVYAEDGARIVVARSIDAAGDHSVVKYLNLTINGDLPKGTVKINDDADYTNSLTVALKLNATDSTGISSMIVSDSPDFVGATWEPYAISKAFTMSAGDGYRSVFAKFKDMYGTESKAVNDTIMVDTTPPNGTITINDGAKYTTVPEVVLKMTYNDKNGVTGMMISEDPTYAGLSPRVPYDTEFFTLSKKDGEKTIHARFIDIAGNYADRSATIVMDTTEPTGTLRINSNAAVTITRMVNLTIDGKDSSGIVDMMVSNKDTFNGSQWETYSEYKIWELASGAGDKVVFVKLRDKAGLVSEAISDSIVYEPPPDEGIIVINDGDGYTADRNVSLKISIGGLGTVTQMMVSNDRTFKNITWEPFAENKAWELTDGDGEKDVYVKFLTLAGIETEWFKDNITLDTKAPVVVVAEPMNSTTFKQPTVPLRVKATDSRGVEKVEVMVDDSGVWEEAAPDPAVPDFFTFDALLGAKGEHTIKVKAMDSAGNEDETQITVYYKPKKKDGTPFLDMALVMTAVVLALVLVGRRRH